MGSKSLNRRELLKSSAAFAGGLTLGAAAPAASRSQTHRRGFRLFWTWKSRQRTGRPGVPAAVRSLIRELSTANPLWGAPRIHGELQMLGSR